MLGPYLFVLVKIFCCLILFLILSSVKGYSLHTISRTNTDAESMTPLSASTTEVIERGSVSTLSLLTPQTHSLCPSFKLSLLASLLQTLTPYAPPPNSHSLRPSSKLSFLMPLHRTLTLYAPPPNSHSLRPSSKLSLLMLILQTHSLYPPPNSHSLCSSSKLTPPLLKTTYAPPPNSHSLCLSSKLSLLVSLLQILTPYAPRPNSYSLRPSSKLSLLMPLLQTVTPYAPLPNSHSLRSSSRLSLFTPLLHTLTPEFLVSVKLPPVLCSLLILPPAVITPGFLRMSTHCALLLY